MNIIKNKEVILLTRNLLCLMAVVLISTVGFSQTVGKSAKKIIEHGNQFWAWATTDGLTTIVKDEPNRYHSNVPPSSYAIPRTLIHDTQGSSGRYVRMQLRYRSKLTVKEILIYSGGTNVTQNTGVSATQSSTANNNAASKVIDNSLSTYNETTLEWEPWIDIDLGASKSIDSIVVKVRDFTTVWEWTFPNAFYIFVSDSDFIDSGGNNFSLEEMLNNSSGSSPTIDKFFLERSDIYDAPYDYDLVGDDFDDLGLTALNWLRPGCYHREYHSLHPEGKWAFLPQATIQDSHTKAIANPIPSDILASGDLLSTEQKTVANNLVCIVLGDEQSYSTGQVNTFETWSEFVDEHYPTAMSSTNQWAGQWNESQLRTLATTTKVDLMTHDVYPFGPSRANETSAGYLYGANSTYRKICTLEGRTGDGSKPIAWGAHLNGYIKGDGSNNYNGYYVPSESQILAKAFAIWTGGGKWINIWTTNIAGKARRSIIDETDNTRTTSYNHFAKIGLYNKNLSPHLSRLTSDHLAAVRGKLPSGTTTSLPSGIIDWSSTADTDNYLSDVSVDNPSSSHNNGYNGDVYLGFFKPINNLFADGTVSNGPILTQDTRYFMVHNMLLKGNGSTTDAIYSQGWYNNLDDGPPSSSVQNITLTFNFVSGGIPKLYRVNRDTGNSEQISLTHTSGSTYTYTFSLGGGLGELFYWSGGSINLALDGTATQSSVNPGNAVASRANDGNTNGNYPAGSVAHTDQDENTNQDYWEVDLGQIANIEEIKVWNRTDCCASRLSNFHVFVSDVPFDSITVSGSQAQSGVADYHNTGEAGRPTTITMSQGQTGRYVRLQLESTTNSINLAELEVYGTIGASVPGQASSPSPINGAVDVSITTDVSWTAGSGTNSHDVYFGTSNPPVFVGNQTGTTYDPGTLAGSTTYYWRVDEKNAEGTTTGTVWSFTTEMPNLALDGTATQSSVNSGNAVASRANDGDTNGNYPAGSVAHTDQNESTNQDYWEVDLGEIANIEEIKVWNRTDCCASRLSNFHVFVSDVPFDSITVSGSQAQSGVADYHTTGEAGRPTTIAMSQGQTGRYVRLQLESTTDPINLAELEVFGTYSSSSNLKAARIPEMVNNAIVESLAVYPNPVGNNGTLKVDISSRLKQDNLQVHLINMQGQQLMKRMINIEKGMNRLEFNTNSLQNGTYLIKISGNEINVMKKVLVAR